MIKLFLTSSFKDVADYLKPFVGEELNGKTITFIPTASIPETYKGYVDNDRNALERLGLSIEELDISKFPKEKIQEVIEKNDFIYVSGGNTFYLLQELKDSGTDKIIRAQIEKGKVYIGASAGSIVMSHDIEYVEKIDDRTKAKKLKDLNALAVVDFYTLPHHTNEPFREVVEEIFNEFKDKINLIPISNTEAIQVVDDKIKIVGRK